MICRTLDLVKLSASSQFYASDDDSADYSGDDATLSELFAQTQKTIEDTLVDDTAAQTQETIEDTRVDDTAAQTQTIEDTRVDAQTQETNEDTRVSEDPYYDAAEPMKTFCVDEEDGDFFKRQAELSDDYDDSDKEYECLLCTGCTCDIRDTTQYVHRHAKLAICMNPHLSGEHQTYYLNGDTFHLQCMV